MTEVTLLLIEDLYRTLNNIEDCADTFISALALSQLRDFRDYLSEVIDKHD